MTQRPKSREETPKEGDGEEAIYRMQKPHTPCGMRGSLSATTRSILCAYRNLSETDQNYFNEQRLWTKAKWSASPIGPKRKCRVS
jgi:hypothetical protein